jgi:hypothetical protein
VRFSITAGGCTRTWATAPRPKPLPTTRPEQRPDHDNHQELSNILDLGRLRASGELLEAAVIASREGRPAHGALSSAGLLPRPSTWHRGAGRAACRSSLGSSTRRRSRLPRVVRTPGLRAMAAERKSEPGPTSRRHSHSVGMLPSTITDTDRSGEAEHVQHQPASGSIPAAAEPFA